MADQSVTDRREQFIQALRECANFFEAHPGVAVPRYTVLNVFLQSREQIAEQARAAANWQKVYNDNWFYLRKEFGPEFALELNVPRGEVCRREPTGVKRLVPATPEHEEEEYVWVCDEPALLGVQS